jgi:thioester reductase-like protein
VSKVYALNRKDQSPLSIKEKQIATLMERGLTLSEEEWEKVVLIECDLSVPSFGLDAELFNTIQSTVTHILHNAWALNFNLALQSFQPLLQGVRHLVDLALGSPQPTPARLLFVSSVGVVHDWPYETPVPEGPITDTKIVTSTGYASAKWVSERILENAAKSTALQPIIVRVGQLSGGVNGYWNQDEWFPSLVRAAEVIKCVPGGDEEVSFIPVHIAASALVDMRNASALHLHLAHPSRISWIAIANLLSYRFKVPIVPYNEWLSALENSVSLASSEVEATRKNPALKLLKTFQNAAVVPRKGREVLGLPRLDTQEAVRTSPTLQDSAALRLDAKDVYSWFGYWKDIGFLSSN